MRETLRRGLGAGQVHWWFSIPDHWPPVGSLPSCNQFLDAEERGRLGRLRGGELSHLYFVSHVLLRAALSHYADLSPGEWRFRREKFGRLELAPEHQGQGPLRFTLAHTKGLATCAIVLRDAIGVDAEAMEAHRADGIAGAFAAAERESLRGLHPDALSARVLQYWTLKEAFLKALGVGLRVPLNSISFSSAAGAWGLTCDPQIERSPASWSFVSFPPTICHQAALAVRRPAFPETEVRYFWLDADCNARPITA